MGDLLLKHKPPRQPQWQSTDMLSRKSFPPSYQNHRPNQRASFNYHPNEPARWREGTYYSSPVYSFPPKSKDHYFLTPYYRNVMPPPPNPNRLLMIDPRRKFSVNGGPSPCQCRSKSMEDVRTDVVEVNGNHWEDDINGNHVTRTSDKFNRYSNRRSMENLLVDTGYSPNSKRSSKLKVRALFRVDLRVSFYYKLFKAIQKVLSSL